MLQWCRNKYRIKRVPGSITRHICLIGPTMKMCPKVRAVDFEWCPCSDLHHVTAPYKCIIIIIILIPQVVKKPEVKN